MEILCLFTYSSTDNNCGSYFLNNAAMNMEALGFVWLPTFSFWGAGAGNAVKDLDTTW